jgi:hypothetical protein
MVNLDTQEFTIWAANPTTESQIIAVGSDDAAQCSTSPLPLSNTTSVSSTTSATATAGPASSAVLNNPAAEPSIKSSSIHLSAGALIGIIIGAIAGVVVIGLIIVALSNQKKVETIDAEVSTHDEKKVLDLDIYFGDAKADIYEKSCRIPPQELYNSPQLAQLHADELPRKHITHELAS